jgi:hypothetical protein
MKGQPETVHATYLRSSGTVVSFVESPEAGASATPEKFSGLDVAKDVQNWDSNNLWPVETRLKIEASTTAFPLIGNMACMMFGKGVRYYREVRSGSEITKDFSPIPIVDQFLQDNNVNYLMLERLMDYKTYGNIFCEFILNKNNTASKIVNIAHKEAEFTRFGKIDVDTIVNVAYKSDWAKSDTPTEIPFVMRRHLSKAGIFKVAKSKRKFVAHSCLPSPGRTLYAMPLHAGMLKKNGWLDYANSIPELMNAINKNGMLLRYHIQIPSSYWPALYKDWAILDQDKRDALIDAKLDEMDQFLKGTDNAGSSFISHFVADQITGKAQDGWKIEPINDPIKKDQFLTSVQEADIQISRAIGMDASLSGIQPAGGKMGAGSGSDKRVGFTNTLNMTYAEQMIILEPLEIVKMYNYWDANIRFMFEHEIPTTLNENKNGVKSDL